MLDSEVWGVWGLGLRAIKTEQDVRLRDEEDRRDQQSTELVVSELSTGPYHQ